MTIFVRHEEFHKNLQKQKLKGIASSKDLYFE